MAPPSEQNSRQWTALALAVARKVGTFPLQIFNQISIDTNPKKNIIVISADAHSDLLSEAATASLHSTGWNVLHLGDMSSAINVLFDLDLQKLMGKIWKQKSGVMIILVFSNTEEGLHFFAESINSIKEKLGKRIRLALCGKVGKKKKSTPIDYLKNLKISFNGLKLSLKVQNN